MIKPAFQTLLQHFPRKTSREELFADIGWADLIGNKAYLDTCAIRMSYGLLRAGVHLPGARMRANAGPLKGQYIEPGQAKLSNILKGIWGAPEVYQGEAAAVDGMGSRAGVVSFFRISRGDGGHIDLIWLEPGRLLQDCARSCYFSAVTIWFWPLR
jgi:hypothetical protein